MKKLLVCFFASFLLIACNNNGGTGGGWTAQEKSQFMDPCTQGGQDKQICSCVLEKLMKKYPTFREADTKGTAEEGRQMAMECMNGGGLMGNDDEKKKKPNPNDNDNNNTGKGWSKNDRNTFGGQCHTSLTNAGYDDSRARQLCTCIIDKLEKKYATLDEANAKGGAQAGANARQECENGGNDDGGNDDY